MRQERANRVQLNGRLKQCCLAHFIKKAAAIFSFWKHTNYRFKLAINFFKTSFRLLRSIGRPFI